MRKFELDVEDIKRLVKLVERHELAELSFEEEGLSVSIKGYSAATHTPSQAQVIHHPSPQAEAAAPTRVEKQAAEPEEENIIKIAASLVGVFYRSHSPDIPPFVEVGDTIQIGQEVGLIEAMKVFSPIPSEVAGTVVAIPAENGKLVQQGDVLVLIRPVEE